MTFIISMRYFGASNLPLQKQRQAPSRQAGVLTAINQHLSPRHEKPATKNPQSITAKTTVK
ncbi:MAG: hypothetical protein KUG79_05895 [Pseudomonadales bacterium]|nr:hypothetical protein [Pseudomonadales bacterium]